MRNKTISFLVAFAMLISIVVQPVSAVVNTASQEASIEKLSLCITDNNAPNAEALVESRFDKYIEAGFESVRSCLVGQQLHLLTGHFKKNLA